MRRRIYWALMWVYGLLRPNTRGVKGLVVDDRGRVVLVRHSYVGGWHLPGGGIKRGETAEEAVARELREEVGIEMATAGEVLGRYSDRISGRSDVLSVFVVRDWKQSVHANLEIAQARFFDPDDLPDGTTGATRRRLLEWQGRREISSTW